MAWYDQISRMYDWRDRQVEKAREAGKAARLRRNPDAGPLRPLPSRRPRYDLNYQPWQREMVDPSHGGGKFGAPGIGGEGLLASALLGPGIGYRAAFGASRLMPQFLRGRNLSNKVPFIPHARGGSVFRGTRFGDKATAQDMIAHYTRPSAAVRPTRGIIRSAFKPKPSTLGYSQRLDQSLRGVRPYRNPSGGIGLYKGTRTGPLNQPPPRAPNPLQRAAQWWRFNNPWM